MYKETFGPVISVYEALRDEPERAATLDREFLDFAHRANRGAPDGWAEYPCDGWEQASHNGDLAHAVAAGVVGRSDVGQLGDVLAGLGLGRQSPDDVTVFDSTGLAIQDLAIALAAMEEADDLDLPMLDL